MNNLNKVEKLNRVLNKVLNLVLLNILWIAGTLLGLVVLGIGPSTLAVLSVIREWFRGNDDLSIFKTYVTNYKNYFKEGTILSLIYGVVGVILIVDFAYITSWEFKVFFGVMLFLYFLSLVYVFPIVVHYNLKNLKEKIKYSFLIGFSYLQHTLILFVATGVIVFAVAQILPALFTLYGASFPLFMIMWNAINVFKIIEKSFEEEEKEKKSKKGSWKTQAQRGNIHKERQVLETK